MANTHTDRIWQSNCLDHEKALQIHLDQLGIKHQLVDALPVENNFNDIDLSKMHDDTDGLVTDNHFRFINNSINLAPEFYSIYRCPDIGYDENPTYKYNCLMNRISGERYRVFEALYTNKLLDQGIVSCNCAFREFDTKTPVEDFVKYYNIDDAKQEVLDLLPKYTELDPDQAAMQSHISVVCETYCTHNTIAFSEKIFRALQTPRPWLLMSSPNSLNVLRDYEFDVLDDCIDHSYDTEVDIGARLTKLLVELQKDYDFKINRYKEAVLHNQKRLDKLAQDWPRKLSYILQSIDDNSHS